MAASKTKFRRSPAQASIETARMTAELPGATAVVLAHRLPGIARGLLEPGRRDDAELRRMVGEKVDAGRQASGAAARGAVEAGSVVARGLRKQARAQAAAAKAVRGGRPGSMLGQWAILGGASLVMALELMTVGSRTARATIAPAHRKVTANARRLTRKAKTKT